MIATPVKPVARGLIFMEMPVVIVVHNDDQPSVVEQAQSWRHKSFIARGQIRLVNFAMFVPGRAAIVARAGSRSDSATTNGRRHRYRSTGIFRSAIPRYQDSW